MKRQYIYPHHMRSKAKLWFWNLREVIIIGVLMTVSVVCWAKLDMVLPAAVTLVYTFLAVRIDDDSVLDYISRALKFFMSTQQSFEWEERDNGK